ncbi:hypothetical protein KY284_026321 [Solanum tuberosum]|nr:hypothetical protein KY284_026321 [Solanum tuberosum]
MDVLKVFDEKLSGYCLIVFAEMQSDTLNEIAGEEAKSIAGIASNLSYGGEEHDEGNLLLNLGATTFIVHVQITASNLYVWDPRISSEFQILTSSNKNVETSALFEEIR